MFGRFLCWITRCHKLAEYTREGYFDDIICHRCGKTITEGKPLLQIIAPDGITIIDKHYEVKSGVATMTWGEIPTELLKEM